MLGAEKLKTKFEEAEKAIDRDEHDLVLCLLINESKKEIKQKIVWFAEDVEQPLEACMMCTINGDTFFCSQRIPRLETQVHHVISPTMTLAYMMSPTLMSPSNVASVSCPLQRYASTKSRCGKSMGLNRSIHYDL